MIYLQPPPVQDDPEVILVEHQNGKGLNGDVVADNEEEAMLPKETSKQSWVCTNKKIFDTYIYQLPIHTIIFDLIIIYINIRSLC